MHVAVVSDFWSQQHNAHISAKCVSRVFCGTQRMNLGRQLLNGIAIEEEARQVAVGGFGSRSATGCTRVAFLAS